MEFKVSFRTYEVVGGVPQTSAWDDWSFWLNNPGDLEKQVESDNEGEAGVVVFDNFECEFLFSETVGGINNPVYDNFGSGLDVKPRFEIKVEALNETAQVKGIFFGMVDFSTIKYPVYKEPSGEYIPAIRFEVADRLSSLAVLVSSQRQRSDWADIWTRMPGNVTYGGNPGIVYGTADWNSCGFDILPANYKLNPFGEDILVLVTSNRTQTTDTMIDQAAVFQRNVTSITQTGANEIEITWSLAHGLDVYDCVYIGGTSNSTYNDHNFVITSVVDTYKVRCYAYSVAGSATGGTSLLLPKDDAVIKPGETFTWPVSSVETPEGELDVFCVQSGILLFRYSDSAPLYQGIMTWMKVVPYSTELRDDTTYLPGLPVDEDDSGGHGVGNIYFASSEYYNKAENYIDMWEAYTPLRGMPIVKNFDAFKIIECIVQSRYPDIVLHTEVRDSGNNPITAYKLPVNIFPRLIDNYPLGSEPLDAIIELANTMRCWMYIDSSGDLVIVNQKGSEARTPVTITTAIERKFVTNEKAHFWQKLVDTAEVYVKSWIPDTDLNGNWTGKYLDGAGYAQKTAGLLPRNTVNKELTVSEYDLTTYGVTVDANSGLHHASIPDNAEFRDLKVLNYVADQIAQEYLLFYGSRRSAYEISIDDVDWDMMGWTMMDKFSYNSGSFFFSNMKLSIGGRSLSFTMVDYTGVASFPLDNVVVGKKEDSFVGGGGGSGSTVTSYGGTYTTGISPLVWDGGPAYLNASLGRQSLGLTLDWANTLLADWEGGDHIHILGSTVSGFPIDEGTWQADPIEGGYIKYNTTNLRTNPATYLDTIQDINSTATPQFAKLGLGKTPSAVLDITSSLTTENMGVALSNSNSPGNTWKIWMGTPGNYDNYFKIGMNPANQNDWVGVIFKSTGGVLSMTEAVSAPYHRAPMTGFGDYSLVGWTGSGGNFSGTAFLSADTGNTPASSANLNLIFGRTASSLFSIYAGDTLVQTITNPGVARFYYNLTQQPNAGSSITIGDGSYIRASSSMFLDTVASTGGDIYIRPQVTTVALFTPVGVSVGGATVVESLNLTGNFRHTGNYSFFNNFLSGFQGTGWRIDYGVTSNGQATIEADDMFLRGTLTVYELLINQIRATNGSLWVTSAARVESHTGGDPDIITFEDVTNHNVTPFAVGDLIMCQRVSLNGGVVVKRIIKEITALNGLDATVEDVPDAPANVGNIEAGDDFVRFGNTDTVNYANRQGAVYLTSDDSNSPFIDIYDGVTSWTTYKDITKNKARIGKLTGVATSPWGTLDGYGIYTSNAYLYGNIKVWGTISAGDAYGFEPVFYAGRQNVNLFKISEDAVAGDTGFALWVWNNGSNYTAQNVTASGPGGVDVQVAKIQRTSSSGSLALVIDGQNSRCWVGDQGEFDDKQWCISFWMRSIGSGTSITYNWTVDFPDGSQQYTKNYTLENGIWQRLEFPLDSTGLSGGYPKVATISLPYHATHYVELYGFQLEEGLIANIYLPTSGTSVGPTSEFGMWAIKGGFGGTLANPTIALKDSGIVVRSSDAGSATWLGTSTISIGYTANEWGIIGKSGTNKVFELGSTNQIAGWTFTNSQFYKGQVRLDSTTDSSGLIVDDGSDDMIWVGDFTYASLAYNAEDMTSTVFSAYDITNQTVGNLVNEYAHYFVRGEYDHNDDVDHYGLSQFDYFKGVLNGTTYLCVRPLYRPIAYCDYGWVQWFDDLGPVRGKIIEVEFKLAFANSEYNNGGGPFRVSLVYELNGSPTQSRPIVEQVLFSGTQADINSAPWYQEYDKTGANKFTIEVPYFLDEWNTYWTGNVGLYFQFGEKWQNPNNDYDPVDLCIGAVKINGYLKNKIAITQDGFEVYNSPNTYLRFRNNTYEIVASGLKIGNAYVGQYFGSFATPPTTPQPGAMYYDTTSGSWWITDGTIQSDGTPNWDELALGGSGGEVNTGANVGTGSGVFYQKSGVELQFRRLASANSFLTIAENTTQVLFTLNTGTSSSTVAVGDHTHASLYQPLDADLTSIAGLGFTSTAFLKKTAANTWALDTATYLTGNQSITISGDVSGSGATSISATVNGIKGSSVPALSTGYLRYTGAAWQFLNETYSLSSHTHSGVYEPVITAGTTGQYWRGDKSWQTLNSTAVGLGNVTNEAQIAKSIGTTKGDIIVFTANATPSRLAVDVTNGYVLTIDNTTATGVKWASVGTGSITLTGHVTGSGSGSITTTLDVAAITGQTALTSGLTSTDELLVNDGGVIKRMDISVLTNYISSGGIIGITNNILNIGFPSDYLVAIGDSSYSNSGTIFSVDDQNKRFVFEGSTASYIYFNIPTVTASQILITDASKHLSSTTFDGITPTQSGHTNEFLKTSGSATSWTTEMVHSISGGNVTVTLGGGTYAGKILITEPTNKDTGSIYMNSDEVDLYIQTSSGSVYINDDLYVVGYVQTLGQFKMDAGTTNADGLVWGTEIHVFRSAANTLSIDSQLALVYSGSKDTLVIGNSTGGTVGLTIRDSTIGDAVLYKSGSTGLRTDGTFQAAGFISSDGTAGYTGTITIYDASADGYIYITVKNGLITDWTPA